MKRKISEKLGRRGKIGLAVFMAFMFIGVASAGLLTYYGKIQTTVNVSQSIVFDGMEDNTLIEHSFDTVGGCCVCVKEKIKNRACVEGTVDLDTVVTSPSGPVGVTTTIYQVPEFTTLVLENKDSTTWQTIPDTTQATLTFQTIKTTFDYDFVATGLDVDTEYTLLYYADYEDRINDWGGDNPGAFIATFTTDASGDVLATSGSIDLGMNLPSEPDKNIAYHDYSGSPDFYDHAHGAKIWLVPSVDYDVSQKKVINWNPNDFLFETDLVSYSDCNLEAPCWLAPLLGDPITCDLDIPAKTTMGLVFCYTFAMNIIPDTYTITTTATPVVTP